MSRSGFPSMLQAALVLPLAVPGMLPPAIPVALAVPAPAAFPIQADRRGRGPHPTVTTSAAGVPVVQILPPARAGGPSINRFLHFNIGPGGLILNNSNGGSATALAGQVTGNPMLGHRHAGVIINQVTGDDPSVLLGMLEVAGRRATVVVANPAGIVCNGCGASGADRLVLATGHPSWDAAGRLGGFEVRQGRIVIGEAGLHAPDAAVDLLGRAIAVHGAVRGHRIDAVAGANAVRYAGAMDGMPTDAAAQATPQIGGGNPPDLAIDASALGGMYGRAVRLIGTEHGVGFRLGGPVEARSGDLLVEAQGKVAIAQTATLHASQSIAVIGSELDNEGGVRANRNVAVRTTARDNLMRNAGSVRAGGDLTLDGARVVNDGDLVAKGSVRVRAGELLRSGGRITASHDIALLAQSLDLAGGVIVAGGQALIEASGDVAHGGARMQGGNVQIHTDGDFDNAAGQVDGKAGAVAVRAYRVANGRGELKAASDMVVRAATVIDNDHGRMTAGAALQTFASQLRNGEGQIKAGDGGVSLHGEATNLAGRIITGGPLAMQGGGLDNRSGRIEAGLAVLELAGRALDNRHGVMETGALTVQGGAIDNRDGRLAAGDALAIDTRGAALHNDHGQLQAGSGPMRLHAGSLGNHEGAMASGADLELRAPELDNRQGAVTAGRQLFVATGRLNNRDGRLQAAERLAVRTRAIDNAGGTLAADLVHVVLAGDGHPASEAEAEVPAAAPQPVQ